MNKIGLFYGSNLGSTTEIAEKIERKLNNKADIFNILDVSKESIEKYNYLILGTSTWGYGELQDDWSSFLEYNPKINLVGKKVAIFGLGDQDSHRDVFVNGIGKLFDYVIRNGASVIGLWDTIGYEYGDETTAVRDNMFVGLPLDEINQPELTEYRIDAWLKLIIEELSYSNI